MKYRVIVGKRAIDDIERNAIWWADHHSAEQALRWYVILEAIYRLESFPESHPIAYENDEFSINLRQRHCGPGSRPTYRAIFTIKAQEVHVLAVRRASEGA